MKRIHGVAALAAVSLLFAGSVWAQDIAVEESASAAVQEQPSLEVRYLFNPVGRSFPVRVKDPLGDGGLQLVLLDANGAILSDRIDVEAGEVDLGELIPDVWKLRRAAYVQLQQGGVSVGPALVLQPMTNRPAMWTMRDVRPGTNTRYTKIIGWGNTPPEGWQSAFEQPAEENGEEAGDSTKPPTPPGDLREFEDAPEPEEEAFTGLRAYPERDVRIETSLGDILIALRPDEAPNTAWNFRDLAANGFYRDVVFHRIVPFDRNGNKFVIQAGDPSGTGNGGAGSWLPMEPSRLQHDFGVISMARADDPDSAGSQFFICLGREGTARLDGQYCAFGYAVQGAKTIRDIASVRLRDVAAGTPEDPPVIRNMHLVPSPPREPGKGRPDRKVDELDETEFQPSRPGRVDR